jgi:hypothetical protein
MSIPSFGTINQQFKELTASFETFTRQSFSTPQLQINAHEELKAKAQALYRSFTALTTELTTESEEIDSLDRSIRSLKTRVSFFTLGSVSPDSAGSGSPLRRSPDLSELFQKMQVRASSTEESSSTMPEYPGELKKVRISQQEGHGPLDRETISASECGGVGMGTSAEMIPSLSPVGSPKPPKPKNASKKPPAAKATSIKASLAPGVVEKLIDKDAGTKKQVKAFLQAILIDYPEMAMFNKLYMIGEVVRKIAQIETIWDQETIDAVMANLSDIDLEYPEFINPPGDCPKAIIESLPKFREPEKKNSVEKWKIQLRALLLGSPGLFPPHILSLAEESYHQITEGLPRIEWSKEDPVVQISRIYNLVK